MGYPLLQTKKESKMNRIREILVTKSDKGMFCWTVAFNMYGRERPFCLYLNSEHGHKIFVSQLRSLANIIEDIYAGEK
jgi:hypothetical protein